MTKEVALDVEFLGQATTPRGGSSTGFERHCKVNRKDWGLTWNVALESGGWLVGIEDDRGLIKHDRREQK